jgi:hypothetical protein
MKAYGRWHRIFRKQREGGASRSTSERSVDVLAKHRVAIEAYEKLCAELGEDPADVGLARLLA